MKAKLTPETTEPEFKQFVHDSSDADLQSLMSDADLRPQVLRRIFDIWCEGVIPHKTRKVDSVIRWQIGDKPDIWDMSVCRGECSADPGPSSEPPDITFALGDVPFLRLVARQVNGLQLLAIGRLRISGNRFMAMRIDSWFD